MFAFITFCIHVFRGIKKDIPTVPFIQRKILFGKERNVIHGQIYINADEAKGNI